MSRTISQPRLRRMTGTSDTSKQAEWLRFNYGIVIHPESDDKIRLSEDTLKAAQIKEPLSEGFTMVFDNASQA